MYDHFEGSCATERPAEDDSLASSSAHARVALSRQFALTLSVVLLEHVPGLNSLLAVCCCRSVLNGSLAYTESSLLDYTLLLWPSFVKIFRSRFRGNPSFAFRVRETFLLIGYRSWWYVVDYMRVVR